MTLENETVAAVTADRDRLVVGVNNAPAGRVRLESFALGPQGRAWDWRGAGRLAGNIVFEGDRLAFPFEEEGIVAPGPSPRPGPSIVRASLDLDTGERWSAAPLAPNPWVPDIFWRGERIRLFPASATWRVETDRADVYRVFAPDQPPLRVTGESVADGCRVVVEGQETNRDNQSVISPGESRVLPVIACKDTVYESVGGGVILIKDFAEGRGLERVIRDPRIGL